LGWLLGSTLKTDGSDDMKKIYWIVSFVEKIFGNSYRFDGVGEQGECSFIFYYCFAISGIMRM
jgi:hypothetical protein